MEQPVAICAYQHKLVQLRDSCCLPLSYWYCVVNFKTAFANIRWQIFLSEVASFAGQLPMHCSVRATLGLSELPTSLAPKVRGERSAALCRSSV